MKSFGWLASRAPAFVLLACFALVAGACANSGTVALFKGAQGDGFYGNFCGPNHPKINGGDAVSQLRAIAPVDDLDAICKNHDICYATPSTTRSECDLTLMRLIKTAKWSTGCESSVRTVAQAFPDSFTAVDDGGTVVRNNAPGLITPLNYALAAAVNTAFLPLGGPPRPDKNEPCNNLVVPNTPGAVDNLGLPRRMSERQETSLRIRYNHMQSFDMGWASSIWACARPSQWNTSDPLGNTPFCAARQNSMQFIMLQSVQTMENGNAVTPKMGRAYQITAQMLSKLPKANNVQREAFDTISLNGRDAIRVVFSYSTPQGQRTAVLVAFAAHGGVITLGYTFASAERATLLPVANLMLVGIRV